MLKAEQYPRHTVSPEEPVQQHGDDNPAGNDRQGLRDKHIPQVRIQGQLPGHRLGKALECGVEQVNDIR